MKLDVLLGEAPVAPADVADRVVVVIDVLRAATTAATALMNGARALVPYESVEEAATRARSMDQDTVKLGGERRMERIPGFDFGNSPLEYSRELVEDRTIVFTTSNGTRALSATHASADCFFAGFINASATVDAVSESVNTAKQAAMAETDVTIICSGTDRKLALEDLVCAGRLVRGIRSRFPEADLGDAALLAELTEARYRDTPSALADDAVHARALESAGFTHDVAYCLAIDTVPVAVRYHERQLRAVRDRSAAVAEQ